MKLTGPPMLPQIASSSAWVIRRRKSTIGPALCWIRRKGWQEMAAATRRLMNTSSPRMSGKLSPLTGTGHKSCARPASAARQRLANAKDAKATLRQCRRPSSWPRNCMRKGCRIARSRQSLQGGATSPGADGRMSRRQSRRCWAASAAAPSSVSALPCCGRQGLAWRTTRGYTRPSSPLGSARAPGSP